MIFQSLNSLPSNKRVYPLETYLPSGIYHYNWQEHIIVSVKEDDFGYFKLAEMPRYKQKRHGGKGNTR